MAIIVIKLDTKTLTEQEIHEAFATAYKYQETVSDPNDPLNAVSNPESKSTHFDRQLRDFISNTVYSVNKTQAQKVAGDAVEKPVIEAGK